MQLEQYGAYREFDHQPSEDEIEQAMQDIIFELSPELKNAAIYQHFDGIPERWTIGIKFLL